MPSHRSHVVLSVWPVALLYALGIAQMWPALSGAPSYAARSPASWLSLIALTITVVVFLGAYARGWSELPVGAAGAGPYRTPGSVRLQKLAGMVAWVLVLAWVGLLWGMTIRVGPVSLSHYELLRSILSRPLVLGACVFGLAAAGLYLSQGIAASFRAWGLGSRPETSRRLEVGCTLASALIVLLAINILSHFATGRAYWSPSMGGGSGVADRSSGDTP